MTKVKVVRIYLDEAEHSLEKLMKFLHDEQKVRGVTVFRGISGFGKSGAIHSSSLVDLAFDLPLVVEFFDTPEKAQGTIAKLNALVKPGHVISWSAEVNESETKK